MKKRLGRWLIPCGGALLFLVFLFSGEQGLLRYLRMKGYERDLSSRIGALRAERSVLAAEVARLQGDPLTLEGLARTRMGMVRPGEVVYLLSSGRGEGERKGTH